MKLVAGIFSFFLIFITFFNCTFAEEPPGQLVKVYGYVLEVKDSEILINLGTSSSVKEKCTGQVYIIEKLDGKDKTIYLASIQILKASEAKSTAKILEAKRKIEKGQNVVIKVFKTDDISSVSSLRPLSKPLTPVPIGVHAEAEIVETIRLTKGAGCNIDPVWVPQGDRI
ncbi:MAG TPA: hypothetical protein PL110_12280, partial [Candidatus Eremiobacteraeota bacterium]|nr:hypothetical protein [Candidatus Eremiobacteraeota bacterium]